MTFKSYFQYIAIHNYVVHNQIKNKQVKNRAPWSLIFKVYYIELGTPEHTFSWKNSQLGKNISENLFHSQNQKLGSQNATDFFNLSLKILFYPMLFDTHFITKKKKERRIIHVCCQYFKSSQDVIKCWQSYVFYQMWKQNCPYTNRKWNHMMDRRRDSAAGRTPFLYTVVRYLYSAKNQVSDLLMFSWKPGLYSAKNQVTSLFMFSWKLVFYMVFCRFVRRVSRQCE